MEVKEILQINNFYVVNFLRHCRPNQLLLRDHLDQGQRVADHLKAGLHLVDDRERRGQLVPGFVVPTHHKVGVVRVQHHPDPHEKLLEGVVVVDDGLENVEEGRDDFSGGREVDLTKVLDHEGVVDRHDERASQKFEPVTVPAKFFVRRGEQHLDDVQDEQFRNVRVRRHDFRNFLDILAAQQVRENLVQLNGLADAANDFPGRYVGALVGDFGRQVAVGGRDGSDEAGKIRRQVFDEDAGDPLAVLEEEPSASVVGELKTGAIVAARNGFDALKTRRFPLLRTTPIIKRQTAS